MRPPTSTSSLSLGPACLQHKLWLQCRVTVLLPSHQRVAQGCLPGWDPQKAASRGGGAAWRAAQRVLPFHLLTPSPPPLATGRFLCREPALQLWALGVHLPQGRGHRSQTGTVAPAADKCMGSYGPGGHDCLPVAASLSHSWKQQPLQNLNH